MEKKKKRTYRFSEKTINELWELANQSGTTSTEVVERAIHELYVSTFQPDGGQTEDGGALAEALRQEITLLARQIEVKDGQIADLAANLRAAQALHAAERAPMAIEAGSAGTGDETGDAPTPTRWDYFKASFTGRLA